MKTKLMRVSEFSPEGEEKLADATCVITGKDLNKAEGTTFELTIQESDGNTVGTGVRYIGPGYTPTNEQTTALIKLVLNEIKKWDK